MVESAPPVGLNGESQISVNNPFDAVRWVRARADKRGYVTVDGREYVAGPAWHSRELLVGVRAATVEILADRGRRVALLPRAWGAGEPVRNPLSLVPALVARPRAFGESTIRRDMPAGPVEAVDRMDAAGRRHVNANLRFTVWDCGGNLGPNSSYAARPKSLRYCMGLL